MQQQAIAEIHLLQGLVHYLSVERNPLAPTPDALLHVVRRRLTTFKQRFQC